MVSRYPRTCRGLGGPHLIEGPSDEVGHGRRPSCRKCQRARNALHMRTRGRRRHAEAQSRYAASGKRAIAEARQGARAGRFDEMLSMIPTGREV